MRSPRAGFAVVLAGALLFGGLVAPGWPAADSTRAPRVRSGIPWLGYRIHAEVSPRVVKLGERATYRGWVTVPAGEPVKWLPPEGGGDLTWGRLSARRKRSYTGPVYNVGEEDSVWVEASLQAFRIGDLRLPGLRIELPYVLPRSRPTVRRLPIVHLLVIPVTTAADSNAELRPLRGPLEAPWWERVPWTRVLLTLAALAALAAVMVWLLRRARRAIPGAPPLQAPHDPIAEALAELAALRRLRLPEHGRFAEHAFHLTRILRRTLESVALPTRPGDTTSELLRRLEGMRFERGALDRLAGLLRLWDRVKFARAASSIAEAGRAEEEVETLIRGLAPGAPRQVA